MKKVKLPYGVANYEKIKLGNYLYIDKTKYISLLEDNSDYLVLLRPRRFGKSLFISTLENYYDINQADKFDALFGDTYIGKYPTELKNSYYVLRFNFSGVNTKNEASLFTSFTLNVYHDLYLFLEKYDLRQTINFEYDVENFPPLIGAAELLHEVLTKLATKIKNKIYVLIDEYDQFANELLGFNSNIFSKMVSENGFVRKFYEVLKKKTETSIIDKIFITGVSPITLDSMTSGFNITESLTCDLELHDVMGFTKTELKELMQSVLNDTIYAEKSKEILKEMQYNYDGYMFSKESTNKLYNSDMCLYYLKNYAKYNKPPETLLDKNVSSDYTKLTNLFALKTNEDRERNYTILEDILNGNPQEIILTETLNFEDEFNKYDFISLLFYLGFLTIVKADGECLIMNVPNNSIKELFFKLYFRTLREKYKFSTDVDAIPNIFKQMSTQGKNDLLISTMETILNAMSNRDFQGVNEQFVKSIAFTLSHLSKLYLVKSEYEVTNGYIDLAYLPKIGQTLDYYGIIEFKYIKVADYEKEPDSQISEKKSAALDQLQKYIKDPELAALDRQNKLKKWIVIFCKDRCVLNEEV